MSRITGNEAQGLMEAYSSVYAPQELTEEQVWEEVENWVNFLLDEGYDLSEYTWEDMYDAYVSEDLSGLGAQARQAFGSARRAVGDVMGAGYQGYAGQRTTSSNPLARLSNLSTRAVSKPFREIGSAEKDIISAGAQGMLGKRTTSSNPLARLNNLGNRAVSKPFRELGNFTKGFVTGKPNTPQAKPSAKPPAPSSNKPGVSNIPATIKNSPYTQKNLSGDQYKAYKAGGGDAAMAQGRGTAAEIIARGRKAMKPAAPASGSGSRPVPSSSGTRLAGKMVPTQASTPKPPSPAIGTLGSTKFERRTPTSAELRAAQQARAQGASPEQALQAAQKRNLPTTGPTPAIPDLKSVNADLAKANAPANLNKPAPAGTALAAQQAQQKKNLPPAKPMTQTSSYEWPSGKTIKDLANAYSSIYEAKKKVDQDEDGDNDFADVRIARMVASGMSRAEAIAAVRNKEYNKEDFEYWVNSLVEEGYDLSDYTWDEMAEIYINEWYKGKHGQSEEEHMDSRSDAAKQISGTSTLSGAAYSHRSFKGAGKPARPNQYQDAQGRMTPADRRYLAYRRANLKAGKVNKVGGEKGLPGSKGLPESYEIIASYLLENNFAQTLESANAIIGNMSENWIQEILDEKYIGFKKLESSIAARGGVSDPAAVAASIGRNKYGKKKFQAAAAKSRKMGE